MFLVIGIVGCNDEKPTEPNEVEEMNVSINHILGNNNLTFNTDYTLPSNEVVSFKRYTYILSNFYLVKKDASKVQLNEQYALIDVRKGNTSFKLQDIPMGDYTSIGFTVGLDSLVNHANPNVYASDHPLAPINNSLHWSWQGGYIFTAIEGKTTADTSSFIFHLAGAHNKLNFEFPKTFTKGKPALNVELSYDIAEVFQNPELYTISIDGASTHTTTDPVTHKFIRNMKDVFTLNSISE